jgi:RNase H-like domain found in reverse transcriptase
VEAVLNNKPPTTRKEVRQFIGFANYYSNVWFHRSDFFTPLTELTSNKTKFQWPPQHTTAFERIKKVLGSEALLACPDFTKPFHLYADASDLQLGPVIMQNTKPLACYSYNLNPAMAVVPRQKENSLQS